MLYAVATHEEIGRMGSRVAAGVHRPDVVIGLDVSHDYEAAPGIGDRRMTPQRMGKGMTIATGAIVSEQLARMVAMKAATEAAGKMSKLLTRQFNRARQTAITTELTEIMGGAAGLE